MIVFVAFKNDIDWSSGRRTFAGVCDTEDQAIALLMPDSAVQRKWKDGDPELRGYFSVEEYDTSTGRKVV